MKSIVIEQPGSYEKLLLQERPDPRPLPNEVLIACRACGVNFADCCVRMGVYSSAKEFVGWPITPGFEVAGEVLETGSEVVRFCKGDRVVAVTLFGGYTSVLAVKEQWVFPLPPPLDFVQGAAFPAIYLTASYALQELAHPHPGQSVLVHSAAGGVGSALVQLAKLQGCRVLGVVGGPHKVADVLALGADHVIDKSSENLWKRVEAICPEGVDIVLDANGPETLQLSYDHLAPGGKLIVYGFHTMLSKNRGTPNWFKVLWSYLRTPRFNPLHMTTENKSVLAFNLSYLFNKQLLFDEAMHSLLRLIAEHRIHLPKIRTYPLEQAAQAHRDLETGNTIGKLVLTI